MSRFRNHIPRRLVWLLPALLLGCGQVAIDDGEHFQRAVALDSTGDPRGASIELRNALQQNPAHGEARLLLGKVMLDLGDPLGAASEFERVRRLGINEKEAALGLARARIMAGQYLAALEALDSIDEDRALDTDAGERSPGAAATTDSVGVVAGLRGQALLGEGQALEARETLSTALDRAPQGLDLSMGMSQLLVVEGDLEGAREWAQQATTVDARNASSWELLGDIEQAAGDLDAALAAYNEAVRVSHAPYGPYVKRALVHMERGDLGASEGDLQELRRLGANQSATHYVEGLLRFRQGQYRDARTALELSRSEGASFLLADYFLAASHYAEGNWNQAEQHLRRFLQEAPESPAANRMLAEMRMRQGDHRGAADLLARVLERDPEDSEARTLLARLSLAQGQRGEAVAHLRSAASAKSDNVAGQAALAVALFAAGESEEGFHALDLAREQAPDPRGVEVLRLRQLLNEGRYTDVLQALDRSDETRELQDPVLLNLRAAAQSGSGDLPGAIATLEEVARLDPGNPTATVNLARVARQRREFDEAREIYREALGQNPGNLAILMHWAEMEAEQEDAPRLRQVLETAVETNPDAIEPRLSLARLHMREGNARGTIALLEPLAGSESGELPETLEVLAAAQLAVGRKQQAITTLRRLAERAPDTAAARVGLARAFLQAENLQEARRQLERARELDPGHVSALYMLARLEVAEGRRGEALVLARELQQRSPGNPDFHTFEGDLHAVEGDMKEALAAFRQAYALSPETAFALRIAGAHRNIGEHAEAVDVLAAHLDAQPGQDDARFALAETRLALGQHTEAIADYERLLARHENNVTVLNNLAYLYQLEGDPRARELAERAHAAQPQNPAIADTLGWILVQGNEVERGLELLKMALAGMPADATVRYHHAAALAKTGQTDAAKRALSDLLDETEDFPQRGEAEVLLQSLGER